MTAQVVSSSLISDEMVMVLQNLSPDLCHTDPLMTDEQNYSSGG